MLRRCVVRWLLLVIGSLVLGCSGAPSSDSSPDYIVDGTSTNRPNRNNEEPAATPPPEEEPPPEDTEPSTSGPTTTPTPTRPALVNGDFTDGFNGWKASGDGFGVFTAADGKPRVTTYVGPAGDGVVGKLWQDFPVDDATTELRFLVHGGDARVVLMRGEEVVASAKGKRENTPETPVVWSLVPYRGQTMRVMIDDALTTPWGYVGAGAFELR